MANITFNITESDVLAALRSVILTVVDCDVIRGQINRTAMPKGPFIVLTPTHVMPLSTNVDTFTATEKTITRPAQFSIQIDCYGDQSYQRSIVIASILRDEYAAQQFGPGIQTLYAGDAQQMPLQDASDQFLERWTFESQLQVNSAITLTQETANTLTVGLIDVDAKYPPE